MSITPKILKVMQIFIEKQSLSSKANSHETSVPIFFRITLSCSFSQEVGATFNIAADTCRNSEVSLTA